MLALTLSGWPILITRRYYTYCCGLLRPRSHALTKHLGLLAGFALGVSRDCGEMRSSRLLFYFHRDLEGVLFIYLFFFCLGEVKRRLVVRLL